MARELEGKTALVTGAGRGMGRGIAERLAEAGALVAILDAKPVDAVIAAIRSKGGRAFGVQAEIVPPHGLEGMLSQLDAGFRERTGQTGLDILVNNIGGGHYRSFETTDIELFDWTWALNVRVPFFLTQTLLPRLNEGGRVINIASAGPRIADPGVIAYNMCKAAINNFTIALAKNLGPRGITVNAVSPGSVNIETNAEMLKDPAIVKTIIDDTLLARIGQPSDIADIVFALASPLGRWVTGQNIEASGGYKL
jgi:NAD(P)-dependent dehydrogenase (short-subunit alcohol dehydrogenase family)